MSIASEITDLNTNLQAAKSAVTTKGGTVGDTGLAGLASEIASIPSGGGGDVVNSVVKQFLASTNDINANTFVEFVDSSTIITASAGSTPSGTTISFCSVAIDSNTVFVIGGPSAPLTGRVCTINDGTITVGSTVQLTSSTSINTSFNVHAFLVDTNTVLIFHQGSTSGEVQGQVVTIQNGVITPGTETQIVSRTSVAGYYTAEKITTNKAMVAYRNSQNYYVGAIVSVSNGGIVVGDLAVIDAEASTVNYCGRSITRIDDTHVLVTTRSTSNVGGLNGAICTISGSTITSSGVEQLATLDYAVDSNPSISLRLAADKLLVIPRGGIPLKGLSITINNSTISSVEEITLAVAEYAYDACFDGTYLRIVTETSIYVYELTTSGWCYLTKFSHGSGAPQTGSTKRIVAELGNGDLFMMTKAASTSECQMKLVQLGSRKAIPAESSITGLTKTALTTSTAGDVYLLPLGA